MRFANALGLAALLMSGVLSAGAIAAEPQNATEGVATTSTSPAIAQSPDWKYIVNNAIRTADDYAAVKGSRASFINKPSVELIRVMGGDLKGTYVIQLISKSGHYTSYAQLKPLFDMRADAGDLDDEGNLWEVVLVKFNGVDVK